MQRRHHRLAPRPCPMQRCQHRLARRCVVCHCAVRRCIVIIGIAAICRTKEKEKENNNAENEEGRIRNARCLPFPPRFQSCRCRPPLFHPRRCCCDMRKRRKRTIRSRRRGRVRSARCLPFLSPRFHRCLCRPSFYIPVVVVAACVKEGNQQSGKGGRREKAMYVAYLFSVPVATVAVVVHPFSSPLLLLWRA
jgi:hypothetical protein